MINESYFSALLCDSRNIEIRHKKNNGYWDSVWVSSLDELKTEYIKRRKKGNIYTSLNHVKSHNNRPVRNSDVNRYARIFLDIDPVRPKNSSSTNKELFTACKRASMVKRYLAMHDWPTPAFGISGNGAHLYYRCAIPSVSDFVEILRVIYDGLSRRFNDSLACFDRAVGNPGRISVMYGSVKRKGIATPERPHRVSTISVPRYWYQVSLRQVEKLANIFMSKREDKDMLVKRVVTPFEGNNGDYATLDTLNWLAGIGIDSVPISDGVYGITCPFSSNHTTPSPPNKSDTVIILREGKWDIFHCHHDHCRDFRMLDLIKKFGGVDPYCSKPFVRR